MMYAIVMNVVSPPSILPPQRRLIFLQLKNSLESTRSPVPEVSRNSKVLSTPLFKTLPPSPGATYLPRNNCASALNCR